MPVALVSARIQGIRSYSTDISRSQTLDFYPLTLIVGHNGSGKTSIIEALKFIIAGEEPPLSDSRRNFINTSKKSQPNKNSPFASIEVKFTNVKNEFCIARREILQAYKTATPSISSSYKIGENHWKNVHKQDDWNRNIPLLFNLPNPAILDNVVLCHQEENLWCMGESNNVKSIFDRIFGCEQYKKEIRHIDAEIKTCRTELTMAEKELSYVKERLVYKKSLVLSRETTNNQLEQARQQVRKLGHELEQIKDRKIEIKGKLALFEEKNSELNSLRSKHQDLRNREKELRSSLNKPAIDISVMSDIELESHIQNHGKLVDQMKTKQKEIKAKQENLNSQIAALRTSRAKLQDKINNSKVVELKFSETSEILRKSLESMKVEQDLPELRMDDLDLSVEALKRKESVLLHNKSDLAEQEDSLSSKQQKLLQKISQLEGTIQGLSQRIENKKEFIQKLKKQLSQADPVVRDLSIVSSDLDEMELISNKMPKSDLNSQLSGLIVRSKQTISGLVKTVKQEGSDELTRDVEYEEKELVCCERNLEDSKKKMIKMVSQKSEMELEHSKIRTASKEAHNRSVIFMNARSSFMGVYNQYQQEKKLLAVNNRDRQVEEQQKHDLGIESKQQEVTSLTDQHSTISKQIGDSFELYEDYRMNSQLRDLLKQNNETTERINTLNAELEEIRTLKSLNSELVTIEAEELELSRQQSRLEGQRSLLEKELVRYKQELSTHSKAGRNHAEVLGKVVCNKIIMGDLEKLKTCFQQSIITFHDQMIIKINEALRARWKQIYRGGDIDLIELVDEEITRGKDKKVSNYFIAMRKDGVRMKMREKASAGQKALASIILRIALAELFVKDFSFIALDEPTTNLDPANIESLAKAICGYVKRRLKKGLNIQWIIISHNKEFLQALDAECSPYFYRVELDSEGYSKIIKLCHQDLERASILSENAQGE